MGIIHPFPNSFWTTPIPANAPTHPDSARFVANLVAQVKRYYGTAAVNTTKYTAAVYVVGSDVPAVTVKYSNCQLKGWTDPKFLRQLEHVPIPPGAVPAAGTDAEMAVYQPSTDRLWELWKTQSRPDGWYACWGGMLEQASRSNGIFPYPYGVTATGLSMLGGMVQIAELQAGVISHAVDFGLPETRKGVYSWPANRTDGRIDSPTAIPQGLRFRLDPALDIDALRLHPVARTLCRAIQRYGMVLRDSSGAVSFYFENPQPTVQRTLVSPYTAVFAGKPSYALLAGVPWGRLQALPMHYGQVV
jgi:hypothetical protein